jgi:hypothetical protein
VGHGCSPYVDRFLLGTIPGNITAKILITASIIRHISFYMKIQFKQGTGFQDG